MREAPKFGTLESVTAKTKYVYVQRCPYEMKVAFVALLWTDSFQGSDVVGAACGGFDKWSLEVQFFSARTLNLTTNFSGGFFTTDRPMLRSTRGPLCTPVTKLSWRLNLPCYAT